MISSVPDFAKEIHVCGIEMYEADRRLDYVCIHLIDGRFVDAEPSEVTVAVVFMYVMSLNLHAF